MDTPTTKQCNRCQQMKLLTDFSKNSRHLYGVQNRCRACIAEERLGWSEEYREERKQFQREYYRQHRAPLLAQNTQYRAAHREHLIQLDREKYEQERQARIAAGLGRPIRKQTPDAIECTRCHAMKPPVGFYRLSKYSGKFTSQCRACIRETAKKTRMATQPHDRPQSIEYRAKYRLRKKYGMTPEDRQTMLQQQNNRCALCASEFLCTSRQNSPCVDHCHATGKVRSLLCDRCNTTLGNVQDNMSLLRKMIAYLEQHGVTNDACT